MPAAALARRSSPSPSNTVYMMRLRHKKRRVMSKVRGDEPGNRCSRQARRSKGAAHRAKARSRTSLICSWLWAIDGSPIFARSAHAPRCSALRRYDQDHGRCRCTGNCPPHCARASREGAPAGRTAAGSAPQCDLKHMAPSQLAPRNRLDERLLCSNLFCATHGLMFRKS